MMRPNCILRQRELGTNHIRRMYVHSTTRKLRPVCRFARTSVGLLTRSHWSRGHTTEVGEALGYINDSASTEKRKSYPCNRPWKSYRDITRQGLNVFLKIGSQTAVRLPALCAGRALPVRRFLVLISVGDWVDPRATVRLEGLCQLKNKNTS
jgi:hypothetical protein